MHWRKNITGNMNLIILISFLLIIGSTLIYYFYSFKTGTAINISKTEQEKLVQEANKIQLSIESILKEAVYKSAFSVAMHGGYTSNMPAFSVRDEEFGNVPYYFYEGTELPIPGKKALETAITEEVRANLRNVLKDLKHSHKNFFLTNYTVKVTLYNSTVVKTSLQLNADMGGISLREPYEIILPLRLFYLRNEAAAIIEHGFSVDDRVIEHRLTNHILPHDPQLLGLFCQRDDNKEECYQYPPGKNVSILREHIYTQVILDVNQAVYDFQNFIRRRLQDNSTFIFVKPMGRRGNVYSALTPSNPPEFQFSFIGACGDKLQYECHNRVDKVNGRWKYRYDLFFPVKIVIMDLTPSARIESMGGAPLTYVFYSHVYIKDGNPRAASALAMRDLRCTGPCPLSVSFQDRDGTPLDGTATINQCEFKSKGGTIQAPFPCGDYSLSFFPDRDDYYASDNYNIKLRDSSPTQDNLVNKKVTISGKVLKKKINDKISQDRLIRYLDGIPPAYVTVYYQSMNEKARYYSIIDNHGFYNVTVPEGRYLIMAVPNWYNGLPVHKLKPSFTLFDVAGEDYCDICTLEKDIEMAVISSE